MDISGFRFLVQKKGMKNCFPIPFVFLRFSRMSFKPANVFSFRPEKVLFPLGGVNLRLCLCGVPMYASAQLLDFLAKRKNPRFPNRKPTVSRPEFPDGNYLSRPCISQLIQ
jgi:hypothetical protein